MLKVPCSLLYVSTISLINYPRVTTRGVTVTPRVTVTSCHVAGDVMSRGVTSCHVAGDVMSRDVTSQHVKCTPPAPLL